MARMVELGDFRPLSRPQENEAEPPDLSDFDLAHLPMFSVDSRDALTQTVYVGKAVMKEMWAER